jgi:bifunctional non-homologous end joining protein LigD
MPLPRVQPIVPVSSREPCDDPEWLFELKYDGYRGLCFVEHGRGHFISRNGNTLRRFSALSEQVAAELEVTDAILDGATRSRSVAGGLVRGLSRRPEPR